MVHSARSPRQAARSVRRPRGWNMRTFTLAEAARLVGTSRGTLYRAIKAGRLICTAAGGPGKESVITEEALRQAGYQLPGDPTQLERSRTMDGAFYSTSHDTSYDAL